MATTITEPEETRYAELQTLALDFARHGDTVSLSPMVCAGLPVNLSDHKGQSLLMLATYHGHQEWLLEQGADANKPNDRGQTPLGGVAFKGYLEIAALLLDHGAQIDADNGAGMTPIMFAAMFGRHEMVKMLEQRGASLNRRNKLGLRASLMIKISRWFGKMRGKAV
jgi:uncharacterized protein